MKSYSFDLRQRIFGYALTHSVRATARIFRVSPSTVQELKRLFIETGTLDPRPPGAARPRSISPEGELYLQVLLRETVDLTLDDLCRRYTATYPVPVSPATMHATLKRLNITRKRKSHVDPKKASEAVQSETERYHEQVDTIPLDQRLYLDETGSRQNLTLPYGRAPAGERVIDEKPVSPGEAVSTVAVLSEQGLEGTFSYRGEMTAERFVAYLEVYLLDQLQTGKTLILDQHPVHTAGVVRDFLDRHQIRYVYLPPYSPELNPIEEAWSKVKQFLKRQKARTFDRLLELLHQVQTTITPRDAQGFFQHAEDYSTVSV